MVVELKRAEGSVKKIFILNDVIQTHTFFKSNNAFSVIISGKSKQLIIIRDEQYHSKMEVVYVSNNKPKSWKIFAGKSQRVSE